jgi:hypothetical protein
MESVRVLQMQALRTRLAVRQMEKTNLLNELASSSTSLRRRRLATTRYAAVDADILRIMRDLQQIGGDTRGKRTAPSGNLGAD